MSTKYFPEQRAQSAGTNPVRLQSVDLLIKGFLERINRFRWISFVNNIFYFISRDTNPNGPFLDLGW